MVNFLIVSVVSGVAFVVLDGLVNANPLAIKWLKVYHPLARDKINLAAGIVIDLAYGFILVGLFIILYTSLPGATGMAKGLAYGGMVWVFRGLMYGLSQWMMLRLPLRTLLYLLVSALIELLLLGLLIGALVTV